MIQIPIADMRGEPREGSKIVSQALFGEEIAIFGIRGGWAQIMTPDGYAGWIKREGLGQTGYRKDVETSRLKAHLYAEPDTEFGPLLSLPYGSGLQVIDAADARWTKVALPGGREAFVQKGDIEREPFELVSFAKKFLGLPYTWGGRSSFGYDCSGYVQMLYGRMGIQLPRDARQQAAHPRGIEVNELVLGDLLFWGKEEHDIRHVGMFLENGEFIHTTSRENKPYLRVSLLTDAEWSGNQGVYYPFRMARRFFTKG